MRHQSKNGHDILITIISSFYLSLCSLASVLSLIADVLMGVNCCGKEQWD